MFDNRSIKDLQESVAEIKETLWKNRICPPSYLLPGVAEQFNALEKKVNLILEYLQVSVREVPERTELVRKGGPECPEK